MSLYFVWTRKSLERWDGPQHFDELRWLARMAETRSAAKLHDDKVAGAGFPDSKQ